MSLTEQAPNATGRTPQVQSNGTASAVAVVGAVITTIANFATAIIVARAGAAFAGTFFAATAIVTIIGNSTGLGTMTGLVYFMPTVLNEAKPNPRSLMLLALRPVALLSTVAGGLLFLSAGLLSGAVANDSADQIATMLRILALVVPCWALTVGALGATRGLGSMTPTVVVNQVLRPFGQLVLIGIVVGFDRTPSGSAIAVAWGLPVVAALVVALGWVKRLGGFAGGNSTTVVSATEFWHYTRPRALSTTFQIALERIDVILVSALAGEAAAGIYGTITRFVTAGNFLIFAIGQATSSGLRRALAQGKHADAEELLRRTTGWMVMLSWPYFLIVAVKAEPLAALLNPDFVSGASALVLLGVAMLANSFAGPVDLTLLMLGRSRASLAAAALALTADVAVAWHTIPRYGLVGAALAWGSAVAVQNGLATALVHHFGRLRAVGRPSLVAAGGALVAVVPVGLLMPDTLTGLLLTVGVGGVIWLGWTVTFSSTLGLVDPRRLKAKPAA